MCRLRSLKQSVQVQYSGVSGVLQKMLGDLSGDMEQIEHITRG